MNELLMDDPEVLKPAAMKIYPDEYRIETSSAPIKADWCGHKAEYFIELRTTDRNVFLDIFEYAKQKIAEAIQNERLLP